MGVDVDNCGLSGWGRHDLERGILLCLRTVTMEKLRRGKASTQIGEGELGE